MKRILELGGVAAGVVLIAFGVAAIILSAHGKSTVATSLGSTRCAPSTTAPPIRNNAIQTEDM